MINEQHNQLELAIKQHLAQRQMPNFSNLLFDKILARLDYERQAKQLRPKLWAAAGLFAAGLFLFAVAGEAFWRAFIQTPTSRYLSLIFTDFKLIAANWQDYLLGVLESLPVGYVSVLLTSVLASILLVDFSAHRFVKFRRTLNLAHYGPGEKLI